MIKRKLNLQFCYDTMNSPYFMEIM
ncbi:unnamed protein product, partial [Brachionus calyciflorus]